MALTLHQRYEYREVHRSRLHKAPYNPREISDESAGKLRRNLTERGLLTPLVWNERSGHLVGGHQRLTQLDKMHTHEDYYLGVAVVQLDEKAERELNVFLNNTYAQGAFDVDKVVELLSGGISLENAGFTAEELLLEFGAREDLAALVGPHVGTRGGVDRRKYDEFYGSSRWQTLRANYMAAHPLCEQCLLEGRSDTPSEECDHVVPHRFREELMWDSKNLRALCKTCHMKKTWLDRKAPPLGHHVLVVFRSADDKSAFLKHLGREETMRRMMADELIDYVRPERKWRDTSVEDAFKEARSRIAHQIAGGYE